MNSISSSGTLRNFLDCVKSRRQPISDLEGAHRVATACHLANLSLRLGRKLRWDGDREAVLDDAEAEAIARAALPIAVGRGAQSCPWNKT